MNRRKFISTATSALIYTVCGSTSLGKDDINKDAKPNILFIMTDQQHAGMMSCTGNKWLKTPAMDSLSREGVRFEKAYCANPVCTPSRTSMATGVMPGRLGAFDNGSGMRKAAIPDEVDKNSLGRIIKRAGYDTFYGGKVHMCSALDPRNAGYDEYFRDQRDKLPGACIRFMKKKRNKPFFAVASFINPHDICFAYSAYKGKSRNNMASVDKLYQQALSLPLDQLPPLPENYTIPQDEPEAIEAHLNPKAVTPAITMRKKYDERQWRIYRWIYCRLTEQVDKQIGRILDGLKEAGLEKKTLVVFTSDHGNMDASHRLASKGLFYEESVRVPLIITYKGPAPGKIDKEHLVSTGLDILPTLCDYAGIKPPAHLLGKSLREIAEGKTVNKRRTYVASENGWGRMIRSKKFKYCIYDTGTNREFLVDLENDPGEMRNIANNQRYKKALDVHRQFMKEWIQISKDTAGSKYLKVQANI
ncbi:MAG: sulfatase-like hydrolase/transferase [Sedimentisphaerales bacterium]|nr:sulfatase-like hydrolase/transferase [Sedimentisphaerales bacterium]